MVDAAEQNHYNAADDLKMGMLSDQDPTLLLHEIPSAREAHQSNPERSTDVPKKDSLDEVDKIGDVNFQEIIGENIAMDEPDGKGHSGQDEVNPFAFGPESQEINSQKVTCFIFLEFQLAVWYLIKWLLYLTHNF